jgi:subtilisin family serine protease
MQALAAAAPLDGSASSARGAAAPGHVLVRYAPGKAPILLQGDGDTMHPQLSRSPSKFRPAAVLPGESIDEAVARLSANDDVLFAEPDFYFKSDLKVESVPKPTSRAATTKYPNDYYFSTEAQWALAKISATKAWGITTGSADVRVCLLDSGVQYTHEDLAQNVEFGHDVVTGRDDAWDPSGHGHGTMMAGQIAASTNNYRGLASMAWNITLLPCKFIDDSGMGLNSAAIECVVPPV